MGRLEISARPCKVTNSGSSSLAVPDLSNKDGRTVVTQQNLGGQWTHSNPPKFPGPHSFPVNSLNVPRRDLVRLQIKVI